jgi:hypothetical protein
MIVKHRIPCVFFLQKFDGISSREYTYVCLTRNDLFYKLNKYICSYSVHKNRIKLLVSIIENGVESC